jgi:hypothetical protein
MAPDKGYGSIDLLTYVNILGPLHEEIYWAFERTHHPTNLFPHSFFTTPPVVSTPFVLVRLD